MFEGLGERLNKMKLTLDLNGLIFAGAAFCFGFIIGALML